MHASGIDSRPRLQRWGLQLLPLHRLRTWYEPLASVDFTPSPPLREPRLNFHRQRMLEIRRKLSRHQPQLVPLRRFARQTPRQRRGKVLPALLLLPGRSGPDAGGEGGGRGARGRVGGLVPERGFLGLGEGGEM